MNSESKTNLDDLLHEFKDRDVTHRDVMMETLWSIHVVEEI